jgi:hypothetical protein
MNNRRETWAFLAQCGLESTRIPRIIALLIILVLLLFINGQVNAQTVDTTVSAPMVPVAPLPKQLPVPTPATEWLFDAALTADTLQTLYIHKMPGYTEMNVIEGRRPSESVIIGYGVTCAVLHYIVTRELIKHSTNSVVQMWESGTLGLEVIVVKRNASLGVRFYFP